MRNIGIKIVRRLVNRFHLTDLVKEILKGPIKQMVSDNAVMSSVIEAFGLPWISPPF